jgi:hypothetical protein
MCQTHSWIGGTVQTRSRLLDLPPLGEQLLLVYQAMRLGPLLTNRQLFPREAGTVMCHYPRLRLARLPAVRDRRAWDPGQSRAPVERPFYLQPRRQEGPAKRR